MFTAPIRTAVVTAALCLAPLALRAQATHTATPAKPAPAPTAAPSKPAATPAAGHAGQAMAAPAAAQPAVAKPATAAPAPTPASGPARDARGRFISKKAAEVSATCTDGTTWTGKTRSGACARHGGVKSWN